MSFPNHTQSSSLSENAPKVLLLKNPNLIQEGLNIVGISLKEPQLKPKEKS
jgi:hypothetical protein